GGGEEFALQIGLQGRAPLAAVGGPLLVGLVHAQRQDGEQRDPPADDVDRQHGQGTDRHAHQWAPSFGVSISSTRTPPMSLGWTKMIGVPWAPMRGSPVPRMVAPLARRASRAAMMSLTSKPTCCWPPLGFFARKP